MTEEQFHTIATFLINYLSLEKDPGKTVIIANSNLEQIINNYKSYDFHFIPIDNLNGVTAIKNPLTKKRISLMNFPYGADPNTWEDLTNKKQITLNGSEIIEIKPL